MFLNKTRLGRTNLQITRLCWGCGPLGSLPKDFSYEVSEARAAEVLAAALEGPVNFLDTSAIYGESEERIGRAIRRRGGLPEGFLVATKADRDLATGDFSAAQIRRSVETSMVHFGLTHLPLVYLHDPEYHPMYRQDPEAAFSDLLGPRGAVAELEKMRHEGLISHIGIAGGPIDMMLRFIHTGRFDALITHNRWNLLWQTAAPLLDAAHARGMGIVNAAVYASGILATGPGPSTRAAYRVPSEAINERVRQIQSACLAYGIPMAAAALQFSLRDTRIHSTAVGISSLDHLQDTLRFAVLPIPDELWDELAPLAVRDGDPQKV